MQINERIVSLREGLGLSQQEAAARSPYSQATWSRIESGAKKIHLGDVLAVSAALGCFMSTVLNSGDVLDSLETAARSDVPGQDAESVLSEMGFYLEAKAALRDAGFIS